MWTNIIGYHICYKKERMSNGPIEAHYKNLKHIVLQDQTQKLGRFIRKIDKYYRSITIDIDRTYLDIKLFENIQPGIKLHVSKENKTITTTKTFGSSSNKDLSLFKESWNKKRKLTRLTQPMFSNEFVGLQQIADKVQNIEQNRNLVSLEHDYSLRDDYNPYILYSKKTLESAHKTTYLYAT